MNASERTHLRALDQALLSLVSERARLVLSASQAAPEGVSEDLLRRYQGPLDATGIQALFAAVESVCAAALAREAGR